MKLRLLLGFQNCVISPKLSGIAGGEPNLKLVGFLFVCRFWWWGLVALGFFSSYIT